MNSQKAGGEHSREMAPARLGAALWEAWKGTAPQGKGRQVCADSPGSLVRGQGSAPVKALT